MDITIIYVDDETGDEVQASLPAKYEVCPNCEGHGTHLHPSIRGYAYSREEFEEAFPDEYDKEQYRRRGGIYDVQCRKCDGKRVVAVSDITQCSPEQIATLFAYNESKARSAKYDAEDRATRRMESRGY